MASQGSQQQPGIVNNPELTLGHVDGDGENGFTLSFDDTFKAPEPYTPDQNSENLEARITALQSAVANLKSFLNTYNKNKDNLIADIKKVRVANVQIASNKATNKPGTQS